MFALVVDGHSVTLATIFHFLFFYIKIYILNNTIFPLQICFVVFRAVISFKYSETWLVVK